MKYDAHTIGNGCHESQHLIQHVILHEIPHESLISYNKKVLHLVSVHGLRPMMAIWHQHQHQCEPELPHDVPA